MNPPPPPPLPDDREDVIEVYNPNQEEIQDAEMVIALEGTEQEVAVGGRTTLYHLIMKVYIDSIITPLEEFHAQLKRNAETKRIKIPLLLQVSQTLPNALPTSSAANRLLNNQSFGD